MQTLEGSGLIVTSDGLVVTLDSLVPQGSTFYFYSDGSPVSYQILKRDSKENLALIKIGKNNLPTESFADFTNTKLGERVFLVGTIFDNGTTTNAVNEGIIKSFDENSIQTNISEKNNLAGSPLFNIAGEVLGINTIDFAGNIVSIPVSKIKTFIGM